MIQSIRRNHFDCLTIEMLPDTDAETCIEKLLRQLRSLSKTVDDEFLVFGPVEDEGSGLGYDIGPKLDTMDDDGLVELTSHTQSLTVCQTLLRDGNCAKSVKATFAHSNEMRILVVSVHDIDEGRNRTIDEVPGMQLDAEVLLCLGGQRGIARNNGLHSLSRN